MKPLSFNIWVMRTLVLYPSSLTPSYLVKHLLVTISILLNPYFMAVGAIRQLGHLEDIVILLDHVIGLGSVVASIYMAECFIRNVQTVKELVEQVERLGNEYQAKEVVKSTEKKVRKYSKGILLYGIIGNLCYALFPLVTKSQCEESRQASELSRQRDPCGLVVRVWYYYDISKPPLFYVVFCLELYICLIVTIIVLAITMVLVGLLMHAVAFLKDCGEKIRESCNVESDEMKLKNVKFCIRYHIAIILYSTNVTKAFSSMMLMHITLTSFEISVLGFEVLMVNSRTDSLRFGMHLAGWLVLLYLICFYGQKLIDESTGIGWDAYCTEWYNSPVEIQMDLKLMILRSQKPLTLTAASLGIMSLETYLGVMSTAYSYFTILLNMKED